MLVVTGLLGFPWPAEKYGASDYPFYSIACGFWIFVAASIIALTLAMIGHFLGTKGENASAEPLTEYEMKCSHDYSVFYSM